MALCPLIIRLLIVSWKRPCISSGLYISSNKRHSHAIADRKLLLPCSSEALSGAGLRLRTKRALATHIRQAHSLLTMPHITICVYDKSDNIVALAAEQPQAKRHSQPILHPRITLDDVFAAVLGTKDGRPKALRTPDAALPYGSLRGATQDRFRTNPFAHS